jgi:hypothetical protein
MAVHTPAQQALPDAQALPQALQLLTSVLRLMQVPEQLVCPLAQLQMPA